MCVCVCVCVCVRGLCQLCVPILILSTKNTVLKIRDLNTCPLVSNETKPPGWEEEAATWEEENQETAVLIQQELAERIDEEQFDDDDDEAFEIWDDVRNDLIQ